MAENNTPKTIQDKFPGSNSDPSPLAPIASALSAEQFDKIVELLCDTFDWILWLDNNDNIVRASLGRNHFSG